MTIFNFGPSSAFASFEMASGSSIIIGTSFTSGRRSAGGRLALTPTLPAGMLTPPPPPSLARERDIEKGRKRTGAHRLSERMARR
jgi:hypothetical protein